MRNRTQAEIYSALACVLFLRLSGGTVWSQTNPASPPPDSTSTARESRSQETLLSSQQAQEQHAQLLRAVDLIRRDAAVNFQTYTAGMERIRKDTELNLRRYAAAVDEKVDLLSRSFASERERELQALRRSNRFVLSSASILVGILLLEILFVACMSLRALNRLAARLSVCFSSQSLSPDAAVLETQGSPWVTGNLIREPNPRLQNAMQRLERRISELECTSNRIPAAVQSPLSQGSNPTLAQSGSKTLMAKPGKTSGVSLTLGEGKSLIFLPHENGPARFHTCGNFLRKLWRRFPLARRA